MVATVFGLEKRISLNIKWEHPFTDLNTLCPSDILEDPARTVFVHFVVGAALFPALPVLAVVVLQCPLYLLRVLHPSEYDVHL